MKRAIYMITIGAGFLILLPAIAAVAVLITIVAPFIGDQGDTTEADV